jgi:hypothetical protein
MGGFWEGWGAGSSSLGATKTATAAAMTPDTAIMESQSVCFIGHVFLRPWLQRLSFAESLKLFQTIWQGGDDVVAPSIIHLCPFADFRQCAATAETKPRGAINSANLDAGRFDCGLRHWAGL